jgi:hypothetical protein
MIMVYPPSLPLIDHDDYFPAFEGGESFRDMVKRDRWKTCHKSSVRRCISER